jgi:hypothetical protein
MSEDDPLQEARKQQEYWREQYLEAQASADLERIVLCRERIAQYEAILAGATEQDRQPRSR